MTLPARVVRVDQPIRGVLALGLSSPGERAVLLVAARPESWGVALVRERPRGAPADAFTSMLRRAIVGAELRAIRRGREVTLAFATSAGAMVLAAAPLGSSGAIALTDESGRARLSVGPALGSGVDAGADVPWEALWADGERLAASLAGAGTGERRAALDRALRRAEKQLGRKLAAIEADAARADEAPRLRADATALLSSLHVIGEGDTTVDAIDYTADPPAPRTIAIDRRLGPKGQADALFKKARRLERGAKIAEGRWSATAAELETIAALRTDLERATDDELAAVEDRAIAVGLTLEHVEARARVRPGERKPFRTFTSVDGIAILVGRSAADNDRLTLDHARPHHLWLHARGTSGSHVVVALDRGRDCPPATLADAATLAAHFSRFRSDASVEVQYTPRRFVHKRRGAAAGSVVVEREKVILVAMEAARLGRLMASERR